MFGFSLVGLDIKDAGVDEINEPDGGPVVARSKCYALLAQAFNLPDDEQSERLSDGSVSAALLEAAGELPFAFDATLDPPALASSSDDYQAEYLRLFDVGAGSPPCPLYGGLWTGNRMGVMEEVVRFYNYFGLKASEERRIPPDHLSTELEFMHYLTFREAAAPLPTLAAPYRRAQLDFLERHPGRWFGKLHERLISLHPPAFFTELAELTARFLAADRQHLGGKVPAAVASER